jgi:acetoin:2,6-dichlorophenolindophenol oxidoreductase subunit alpha
MTLPRATLLKAYRRMTEIRQFEERLHKENTTGDIPGFIHLYAGQEAIAVGVCEALLQTDHIASTHRGHGHCIAKGCDIRGMMDEIFGRRSGLCQGKGGSMHIADLSVGMLGANAIVGGASPLAIGAALTHRYKNTQGVAVAFIGDGASNQGTTFEALNMAVVLKLPAVFVFENNGYGEATGCDYSVGSRDIAARAGAFGMPSARVDGTDFAAVHEAAARAVDRARRGEGPSCIEATARRYFGHFEGDAQQYRSTDEVPQLRTQSDPLTKLRKAAANSISADEFDAIDTEVAALIDAVVAEARSAAPPTAADLDTDVYVNY